MFKFLKPDAKLVEENNRLIAEIQRVFMVNDRLTEKLELFSHAMHGIELAMPHPWSGNFEERLGRAAEYYRDQANTVKQLLNDYNYSNLDQLRADLDSVKHVKTLILKSVIEGKK